MAILWSKDLETGNNIIDGQHQELIKAINDLRDACATGKGKEQVGATAKFLLEYTKKHFGDEEQLQKKYAYPDYDNHKKLHEAFINTVQELVNDLNAQGATDLMLNKVNNAVGGWLINHIKVQDVKVAKHIRENS